MQGTAQPAPPTSTSLARGSSKDPSPAPGCKHRTSTWLRCQQPIAKQMPPHSPSPNGCTPGGSKKTQSLLEPLWPMQTGVCNETVSPYWHHEVQATFIPLWLPIPPPLPSSTHKKPGRTGQGSASHGVHSGGSKWRCLSWADPISNDGAWRPGSPTQCQHQEVTVKSITDSSPSHHSPSCPCHVASGDDSVPVWLWLLW